MMAWMKALLAAAAPLPSKAFQASTFDGTSLTTYTFAGQAIGTASATRYVVAAVHLASSVSRTISSVTIGGVSATLIPNGQVVANTYFYRSAFYIAAVPTGTTASVVVTASGGADACAISVWAVYDILSATAVDSDGATVFGTNTFSPPAVTTSAGGLLLSSAFHVTNANPATNAWTNATERSDLSSSFSGIRAGTSGADEPTTGANITVSDALGGAVDGGSMVVATWR